MSVFIWLAIIKRQKNSVSYINSHYHQLATCQGDTVVNMFRLAVLQLFIWFEVLFGLLCLAAVAPGSDQEHCFVPAPSDEDTDPCPPWFIRQEIAGDNKC